MKSEGPRKCFGGEQDQPQDGARGFADLSRWSYSKSDHCISTTNSLLNTHVWEICALTHKRVGESEDKGERTRESVEMEATSSWCSREGSAGNTQASNPRAIYFPSTGRVPRLRWPGRKGMTSSLGNTRHFPWVVATEIPEAPLVRIRESKSLYSSTTYCKNDRKACTSQPAKQWSSMYLKKGFISTPNCPGRAIIHQAQWITRITSEFRKKIKKTWKTDLNDRTQNCSFVKWEEKQVNEFRNKINKQKE